MEAVMHGNWNDNMHDGFGWGWIPMAIMMLLVWGSLLWFGVALFRRTDTHEHAAGTGPSVPPPPNAQQILAERLARGEIEPDDYRTRMEALTTTRP
jgi:putative membrane protein